MSSGLLGQVEAGMKGLKASEKPPSGTVKDLQSVTDGAIVNGLAAHVETFKHSSLGHSVNDRKYTLEELISEASAAPSGSEVRLQLADTIMSRLWDDLKHPPTSFLGKQFMYRAANGSGNNIQFPHIGAAGSNYARAVSAKTVRTADLPDPREVFDRILLRKDFKPHPNGISSFLLHLGLIVIQDLFRTDRGDHNINKATSYLDLGPLYGCDQREQDSVRTFQDGKLKPDSFAEKRVVGFPHGATVLLVMFNRFHNHAADMLRSINEGGRFTKPNNIEDSGLLSKKFAEYDNDLFQTARLITCGLYLNIILKDYLRTILNLNRTDSDFSLDPRKLAGNGVLSQPKHASPGNVVAAEYNLVYRWHSAISPKDQKLAEERWRTLFGDKDPLEVPIPEMLQEFGKLENGLSDDPVSRDIAGLTRGTDKKYDNKALLGLLTASVEDAAGSFGANRVPEILRSMEICGIIFARSWNLAGLNDFREHYGLERYGSFDAINKDPAVAAALKDLYKHPNNVELYPGLVIEDTKMSKHPGSGLCLPFTASRALLSDLVNLVGSDRFYTTDYTPYALTNWGYTEVESDPKVDNGHVLHKLITAALPGLIKNNSVYAHFPFVTPAENSEILSELGVHGQYDWEKP